MPSALSLSSVIVNYSTLLLIGSSCLHILLRFYRHGWLSHICHYLVNPWALCLFIIHIWQKHSEGDYSALSSTSGLLFFYWHRWFSHFRHYLVNQRDLRLSFLLIWQKHSVGDYFYWNGYNKRWIQYIYIYKWIVKNLSQDYQPHWGGGGHIYIKWIILNPKSGISL